MGAMNDAPVPAPPRPELNRWTRTAVLAAMVAGVLYTMSPRATHHTGGIRSPERRRAMPPIELPAIGGGDWSLAQQRGHVVLVNFWATWCPPCREETPELVTVSQRYAAAGLKVVGIAMDDNPRRDVPPFAARFHIGYPLLVPGGGFAFANSIASLPATYLLDRQGRIARTLVGAVAAGDLDEDIARLLREK
jgi:cytochrome c biogenesis protein CcmG, thiol:disulfide interchange protein DsbE